MTIKTFNANRVGGGTFQLEQDAITGEYKLKEVGFVKLPELKLPEIVQAPPLIPDTPDAPDTDLPEVGGAVGSVQTDDKGSKDPDINYQNYMKAVKKEATGGETLMESAKSISKADMGQTGIQIESLNQTESQKTALKAYNDAIENYNRITGNIRELNASGQATDADRKAYDISSKSAQNKLNEARENYEFASGLKLEGTSKTEFVKEAPIISEDLQKFGPKTVQGATGVPDAIISGQLGLPEKNILKQAEEFLKNSVSIKLLETGATILENIAGMTDEQRALNETNKTALKSLGYATKAELGSSIDPGRIVKFDENGRQLSAADNVFVGMNRESLFGNVFEGAAKRVKTRETIGIQRVEARYGKDSQQAKDFKAKTETFKNQIKEAENERDNRQDKSPPKDNNRANMGMRDTSAPTTARDRAMGEAGKLSGPPRSVRFG
jgi:hypothetical protein